MARNELSVATSWITVAAETHGARLASHVAERLGLPRRSAQALLARLVAAQWLRRDGSPRKPVYRPGTLKQVVQRYALRGLQEDLPWTRDFAPFFDLPANVRRMAQHAFMELLNNAIDHSGGSSVTVSLRQTPLHLQLLVSDDGCGVFDRIQQAFEIADPALAMVELGKGRLTSQPDRHCGHGLFFTARLADLFELHANQAAFQFRGLERRRWHSAKPMTHRGTSIYLAIALDTARTLDEVLRAQSADSSGYALECTAVPLTLLTNARTSLESRAQAGRTTARLAQFRRAEIDFTGIEDIGQSFADELFRVFAQQHPGLALVPVGMAPRVAAMIDSVRTVSA